MNATTAAVVRSRFTELGPAGASVEFPAAEKAQAARGTVARDDRTAKEARIACETLDLALWVAVSSKRWCEMPWRYNRASSLRTSVDVRSEVTVQPQPGA